MKLRGGEKGIIANATNTCADPQTAIARFIGQDNAPTSMRVPLKADCKKKHKKTKKGSGGRR
jgi:hypothetical protein